MLKQYSSLDKIVLLTHGKHKIVLITLIFFRQTDTFHYYAFVLKTNGIEFDKKYMY